MLKHILYPVLVTLGITSFAYSSVGISVDTGRLFQSDGTTLIPDGSIVVIFADNNANSLFPTSLDLIDQTLTLGTLYGGDELVYSGATSSGFLSSGLINIDLDGGLAAGTEISVYWFDQTSTDLTPTMGSPISYGTYQSTIPDLATGGTSALLLPADGNTVNISYIDTTFFPGGQATVADFTADQFITAVPEPTGASLLALASGMFMLRRNRKT